MKVSWFYGSAKAPCAGFTAKGLAVLLVMTFAVSNQASETIEPLDEDLQRAIAAAAPYSTIVADRGRVIEIDKTITIDKPLTLVGLHARLKSGLEKTPILRILAENVRIRDFHLTGNADSVEQEGRAPLIEVRRGRFVIENGVTNNSSKDGVMVTPLPKYGDIEHGVIRNITSVGTVRDTVSISGVGEAGLFVRHVLIQDIRARDSRLRGPVEVSDGSEYITVRDIYAENCRYGVDIQDHGREGQFNRHIIIDGLHVKRNKMAVRTANHDFGHDGLTIRNVTGSDWVEGKEPPFEVHNTSNTFIENVRLYGCPAGPCMHISHGDNVMVRDITFNGGGHDGPALLVEDSQNTMIDNIIIAGAEQPQFGVIYRVTTNEQFGGLRIHNVLAPDVRGTGIVIKNESESGSPGAFHLHGNTASVEAPTPASSEETSR